MNFRCPFCQNFQTVTEARKDSGFSFVSVGKNFHGPFGVRYDAVSCANDDCNKVTILVGVYPATRTYDGRMVQNQNECAIVTQRLMPNSSARPQPDYIPQALIEDYEEACKIVELSPKAAATLARRCLQGMIRDFCGIAEKTLYREIQSLKAKLEDGTAPRDVSADSVEAIDNVRGIGNIGAHMEADINHIIPVDREEARLLIELVEHIFEDWYVRRFNTQKRFKKIQELASQKSLLIEEVRKPQLDEG